MRARTTFPVRPVGAVLLLSLLVAAAPVTALAAPSTGTSAAVAGPADAPTDAPPGPPDPATAPLRDTLFDGVNADRSATGLVRYVRDPRLERVAQDRAARLASSSAFSHAAAGAPLLDVVEATGIGPLGVGEDLGWSSLPGTAALASIRDMWKRSALHRGILLSESDSYAGVGVAMAGGRVFAVLVAAETLDRTPPVVGTPTAERRGAGLMVRWTVRDPLLQTHTAGVRDASVQVRVDGGAWRTLDRANARGATVTGALASGHAYAVRVRARDRAGNVSAWVESAPVRIP